MTQPHRRRSTQGPSSSRVLGVRSMLVPLIALGMACGVPDSSESDTEESSSPVADSAAGSECDFWAQDCPEGFKCAPIASEPHANVFSEHRCVVVLDDAGLYETCESFGLVVGNYDDCGPGMMCWGSPPPGHPHEGDLDAHGHCMAFCQGSPEATSCGDSHEWCTSTSQGIVNICAYNCDPRGHDCQPDQRCLWEPALDRFLCGHAAPAAAGAGEDCTGCGNCCEVGLYCADATDAPGCANEQCCNAWCDVGEDVSCPSADEGQVCIPFWPDGEAPPNHETLGQCLVP